MDVGVDVLYNKPGWSNTWRVTNNTLKAGLRVAGCEGESLMSLAGTR
jgi:hypothetical protein